MKTRRPAMPCTLSMFLVATALAAVLGTARPAAADGALATLTADQAAFASSESVVVRLTLANPGDAPIAVLRWLTAADGLEAPLFTVARDGTPVPYVGRIVKRPAPTASDYVEIAAGAAVAWDIDLSDAYDFSVTGTYTIAFDVAAANLYADAGAEGSARLTSPTIALDVAGRPNRTLQKLAANARTATSTYVGCTGPEQSATVTARADATTYATWASAYLQASIVDAHYTLWFGAYNSGRYATVNTHFTNIVNLLGGSAMGFDCSGIDCGTGTYAYVYPTDATHTVYLCDQFWAAPATGTDSRAGTLIHESSHFNDVAGTDDFVYGQTAAQSLATSNPAQAIMNADNHEYFGETSVAPNPTATPTATATSNPGATPTATATPAPGGYGFVPPDADSAKCEKAVAKSLGKLSDCAAACQIKRADAVVKGKTFDEEACAEGLPSCRDSYDTTNDKLFAKGLCPACLDSFAQSNLGDDVTGFIDANNDLAYCAGSTAFGGDDTGFVPPDTDTASCESRVAKSLKKLAACVTKCRAKQVDAAVKGKAFDVDACTRTAAKSCRAAFDAASAKLLGTGLCPPCLDAPGQSNAADAVTSFVESRNAGVYCAGSVALP